MTVSYNKLWKILIDRKMTKTELRVAAEIAPGTLAKMNKNEPVSMDVIFRICQVLKCEFNEIIEIKAKED